MTLSGQRVFRAVSNTCGYGNGFNDEQGDIQLNFTGLDIRGNQLCDGSPSASDCLVHNANQFHDRVMVHGVACFIEPSAYGLSSVSGVYKCCSYDPATQVPKLLCLPGMAAL